MIFGITIFVQSSDLGRRIVRWSTSVGVAAAVLSSLWTGCSLFQSRSGLKTGYYLPLVAQLRQASSVTGAQVTYKDACDQPQSFPIGDLLQEAIQRKTGLVFEKVVTGQKETASPGVDGYVDVALGFDHTDLVIYRKAKRSYPATVTLGLDFAYLDTEGTVLFRKKLQSSSSGEVDVASEGSCEVKGFEKVVQGAIATVTDGMAKQLGESTKIREQAVARKAGTPRPTSAGSPPPLSVQGPPHVEPPPTPPTVPSPAEAARVPVAPPADELTTLTFRAIVRDQNRNLLLHGGEAVAVEVEVKNEGPGVVQGVEIQVSGTPALTEHLSGLITVGELRSGEVKRVTLDGTIGAVKEAVQAELILTLRAGSTSVKLPSAKKFVVAMKPESDAEAALFPVDVDQLPKRAWKLKQPKAVGITIGVEQFRDTGTPRIRYAARDAEVMAMYLKSIVGIPADRVRTFVDSQAMKHDLAEVFEEWLPRQVDPTSVVYVYYSGLGVVDGTSGAVSLVPFDGPASTNSRVYSLRRLQEALTKLPVERAIVMLDVSLEPTPGADPATKVAPIWEPEGSPKDRLMWMVGNRTVQESHRYDPGQHGLFTYQLLKGLGGGADIDKDGMILAGELCTYAKGQVTKMAREQFANEQQPACIPGPGQGALSRLQPVARYK
jgi:Caspase domain